MNSFILIAVVIFLNLSNASADFVDEVQSKWLSKSSQFQDRLQAEIIPLLRSIKKFPTRSSHRSADTWIANNGGQDAIFEYLPPDVQEIPGILKVRDPKAALTALEKKSPLSEDEKVLMIDLVIEIDPMKALIGYMQRTRAFPAQGADPLSKRLFGWLRYPRQGGLAKIYPQLPLDVREMPYVRLEVEPENLLRDLKTKVSAESSLTEEEANVLLDLQIRFEPMQLLESYVFSDPSVPDVKRKLPAQKSDKIGSRLAIWINEKYRNQKALYPHLPKRLQDLASIRAVVDRNGVIADFEKIRRERVLNQDEREVYARLGLDKDTEISIRDFLNDLPPNAKYVSDLGESDPAAVESETPNLPDNSAATQDLDGSLGWRDLFPDLRDRYNPEKFLPLQEDESEEPPKALDGDGHLPPDIASEEQTWLKRWRKKSEKIQKNEILLYVKERKRIPSTHSEDFQERAYARWVSRKYRTNTLFVGVHRELSEISEIRYQIENPRQFKGRALKIDDEERSQRLQKISEIILGTSWWPKQNDEGEAGQLARWINTYFEGRQKEVFRLLSHEAQAELLSGGFKPARKDCTDALREISEPAP